MAGSQFRSQKSSYELNMWAVIICVPLVVIALGGEIYYLYSGVEADRAVKLEQDRITGQIEAFRRNHGRLPEPAELAIVYDREVFDSVNYYPHLKPGTSAWDLQGMFHISCSRSVCILPPTERWWTYDSERGEWATYDECY